MFLAQIIQNILIGNFQTFPLKFFFNVFISIYLYLSLSRQSKRSSLSKKQKQSNSYYSFYIYLSMAKKPSSLSIRGVYFSV